MSKPKKQTWKDRANSERLSLTMQSVKEANLEQAHAALRAALALMREADRIERRDMIICPHCRMQLEPEGDYPHSGDCPRVAAIRLVRAALGE